MFACLYQYHCCYCATATAAAAAAAVTPYAAAWCVRLPVTDTAAATAAAAAAAAATAASPRCQDMFWSRPENMSEIVAHCQAKYVSHQSDSRSAPQQTIWLFIHHLFLMLHSARLSLPPSATSCCSRLLQSPVAVACGAARNSLADFKFHYYDLRLTFCHLQVRDCASPGMDQAGIRRGKWHRFGQYPLSF